MNRWAAIGVVVGVIVATLATNMLTKKPVPTNQKLVDYCTSVSVALAMDAKDLDAHKLEAVTRFGEQVTFHSEYEILLCEKTPVNLEKRPMCAITPDYECLAKLARAAADATKP